MASLVKAVELMLANFPVSFVFTRKYIGRIWSLCHKH